MDHTSDDDLMYYVKWTQSLIRQVSDLELAQVDLTLAQFVVLRELHDEPGLPAAELARRCFITRQSLGDVLAVLRSRRWLEDAGPMVGRARPLRLTRTGQAIRRRGALVMEAVEQRMVYDFSTAERRCLSRMLSRCVTNLGPRH